MKYRTVTLKFISTKETMKQAYEIHLKDFKDSVMAIDDNDSKALNDARLELLELISIIENKQAHKYTKEVVL